MHRLARPSTRRRCAGVSLVLALAAFGLTACLPPAPGSPTVITTEPGLYPDFQAGVIDYVIRCDPAQPTAVHVTTPAGTLVSVDHTYPRSGRFGVWVTESVGRQFTIAVTTDPEHDVTTNYHVRCLPPDFPQWSATRTGTTQAAYYVTTLIDQPNDGTNYSAVFDTNGVPVWWLKDPSATFMLTPMPGQHLATLDGTLREYDLSGQVVQSFSPVGNPDFHEVIKLPNGNYVMNTSDLQPCDLTSWGYGATESCIDHVFQELQPPATPGDPATVVWSWDTSQHIPVSETGPEWRDTHPVGFFDPWHTNSIEDTGDAFIINFRHLNAAYKVDKATGNIDWKLGGSTRPESLTLVDDTRNGMSGEHDARLLPDGTVTMHDNGTNPPGPRLQPRLVRWAIDTDARTATLVEEVKDSSITASQCCGSARKLPGGNWVVGWGGNPTITENQPDGSEVFRLTGTFVYRAIPILPGEFTPDQFRAGMDAQYG